MRLAENLGMTLSELFERMHPQELTLWMAEYNLRAEEEEAERKELERQAKQASKGTKGKTTFNG